MKVAIVVPGGVDRSGTERVIPALLSLIARIAAVHEVHVFALSQEPRPGRWQLRGATVHNAGMPAATIRTVIAILREHRRGAFDVIHAFWVVPAGVAAATAARLIRRPLRIHVAGGELAALPGIRYGGSRTARGRALVSAVLRSADGVTAASAPICGVLARWGIRAERLPLGVALDEWPPAPPVPRDPALPAKLVHVAHINAVKDQTTLIRAAAILARDGFDFTLDLVGGDTTGGEIHRLAAREGVAGRIRFHGFLRHDATRDVLAGAHLFLLSSLHEAGPVAVLEAAVAGVPTVGTRVGHIAEWAPDAALAVPVADAEALAAAAASLLRDDDRRLALAAEAQRRALAENADHTAARTLAWYAMAGSSRRVAAAL